MNETKSVWKFPFRYQDGIIEITMPMGARINFADHNNGEPCIWALVNINNPLEVRKFILLPTGQEYIIDEDKYRLVSIGTFKGLNGGIFVHLFELVNSPVHKYPKEII